MAHYVMQGRIQKFLYGGANPKGSICQLIIWPNFLENCKQMKKLDLRSSQIHQCHGNCIAFLKIKIILCWVFFCNRFGVGFRKILDIGDSQFRWDLPLSMETSRTCDVNLDFLAMPMTKNYCSLESLRITYFPSSCVVFNV